MVNHRTDEFETRLRMQGAAGPLTIVYDNRGRRRVIGPGGHPIGRVVSNAEAELLDQVQAEQADQLGACRGILWSAIAGFLLIAALAYAAFHVGRRYELNELEAARPTHRTTIVPLP